MSDNVVEVVIYNKEWPQMFEMEAKLLRNILGVNFCVAHHIGSTAVPGLCAKPTIDIIVETNNYLSQNEIAKIVNNYYVAKGEYNIPLRQFFTKRTDDISVNLHCYITGNAEVELNLMFRDHLRKYSELADEYAALKLSLAQDEANHEKNNSIFKGYTLNKSPFIQKVLTQAGFDGLCLKFCTHYSELVAYNNICIDNNVVNVMQNKSSNDFYFVLYRGMNVVAGAHLKLQSDGNLVDIRFFAVDKAVSNQQEKDKYYDQMMKMLTEWCFYHGWNFVK